MHAGQPWGFLGGHDRALEGYGGGGLCRDDGGGDQLLGAGGFRLGDIGVSCSGREADAEDKA